MKSNRQTFSLLLVFSILSITNFADEVGQVMADEVVEKVTTQKLSDAPAGTFSLIVIPDTQQYYGRGTKRGSVVKGVLEPVTNPIFQEQTDWILKNHKKQKTVFVTHVGDIVDRNNDNEWKVARACMDKFHGVIPYGISVGNHDMVQKSGDSVFFQKYFGEERFNDFDWYGKSYKSKDKNVSGNNANSYQFFSAEGLDFIILHLECNAPDDVLDWANDVLKKHKDKRAIVTSHMGIGPVERPKEAKDYIDSQKGRMLWGKCHGKKGNTPQEMWDKCYRKHANVFLILCGDQSRSQAVHQSARGRHGNLVHELLSDYGGARHAKDAVRLMRFIPQKNQIEVRTWKAIANQPCLSTSLIPRETDHQFVLSYDMKCSSTP